MADKQDESENLAKYNDHASDKILVNIGGFVYVPDLFHGYVLAKLVNMGIATCTVKVLDSSKTMEIPCGNMVPAEENQTKDADDNCELMYLNEGTLLNNCKIRYQKKQIYTYVANILISINPYEQVPGLYEDEKIQQYRGKSLGVLPPHLFAIADKAYRDMRTAKRSQSVIVSGESGAGKTESQKCILRFLCKSYSDSANELEKKILQTNPILDSFGNAKTVRNNNSSRFGKFVEVHFNETYVVTGGHISHYLLEKTRVCHQQQEERNFHIFYQLFTSDISKLLHLSNPDEFLYLRNGCTQFFATEKSFRNISEEQKFNEPSVMLTDSVVDDFDGYQRLVNALSGIGIEQVLYDELFKALAGILHLGNVEFVENSSSNAGGSKILPSRSNSLTMAAKFLGLEESSLAQGITSRMMQPGRAFEKQTPIMVPLKVHEAIAARDAFAKAIYSRLFDHVVACVNKSIPSEEDTSFIGVLDIAGFESFDVNSFEQFCINYCNEKLQLFFNDRIMKQEQDLYQKECLDVTRVLYTNNQDCIDLYEKKKIGLFDCLDEEMRLPFSSVQHFTSRIHENFGRNSRVEVPRKSSKRQYRSMRDDEGFIVNHYAGPVCYETALFLEKNTDNLHDSLENLLRESRNSFIENSYAHHISGFEAKNAEIGLLKSSSVSKKFRQQLSVLIEKLNKTGAHFVHCVKPNSEMVPSRFCGGEVLAQLRCAGMSSVLKLMQRGYPSRVVFEDLYEMYRGELPSQLAKLDHRSFCECLFHALGLNEDDYKFGITKAFFRAGKMIEFDQLMKQEPENVKLLVGKANSWILQLRWRRILYVVLACTKLARQLKHCAERKKIEKYRHWWKKIFFVCTAFLSFKDMINNRNFILNSSEEKTDKKNIDLSSWTYENLRNVINHSTDMGLKEACSEEYHRRIMNYEKCILEIKKSNK